MKSHRDDHNDDDNDDHNDDDNDDHDDDDVEDDNDDNDDDDGPYDDAKDDDSLQGDRRQMPCDSFKGGQLGRKVQTMMMMMMIMLMMIIMMVTLMMGPWTYVHFFLLLTPLSADFNLYSRLLVTKEDK